MDEMLDVLLDAEPRPKLISYVLFPRKWGRSAHSTETVEGVVQSLGPTRRITMDALRSSRPLRDGRIWPPPRRPGPQRDGRTRSGWPPYPETARAAPNRAPKPDSAPSRPWKCVVARSTA